MGKRTYNNVVPLNLCDIAEFSVKVNYTKDEWRFYIRPRRHINNDIRYVYYIQLNHPDPRQRAKYCATINIYNQIVTTKKVESMEGHHIFKWFWKLYCGTQTQMNTLKNIVSFDIFKTCRYCPCGRQLTTPKSILLGVGPSCKKKAWKNAYGGWVVPEKVRKPRKPGVIKKPRIKKTYTNNNILNLHNARYSRY